MVGPPVDREDFDQGSYQDSLRQLQIPPWPQTKSVSVSPQTRARGSSSPPAHVAASAPSPSAQVLGPSPWEVYEQDPNRPPASPQPDVQFSAEPELPDANAVIAQAMHKLDIKDGSWRFHGKASSHHLILAFNEMREAVGGRDLLDGVNKEKRQEYWHVPEWEIVVAHHGLNALDLSVWPESGLDQDLIDAYFKYTNFNLPLLNRLVFQKQFDAGLYKTSHDFAKVCLMVFANGSRFVDDERVYWPRDAAMTEEGKERLRTDSDGTLRYSAGWKYLRSILEMGRSIMQGPNLFDFQSQVLICSFLYGTAVPHLTWIVSGLGLRAAQEIGIHVRSVLLHAHPTERALYSRAFWCLYHIDRTHSAGIGRSVALQDSDFDADYPIPVDDEYWDTGDPERDFQQPPGTLSKVAAFVHTLKLDHVIGATLRTIYAINKLPERQADPSAQRAIVVELDSALNSWADAVPDGLRWDPSRADQQLFEQSATLYVHYYYCQILVHRPFIPLKNNTPSIGLPALAICANASRSICNITDTVLRRGRQLAMLPGRILSVNFMLPSWIAAIVLLICVYSGDQQQAERERTIGDIKKCLAAMREIELTWRQGGKLTDVLMELTRDLFDLPHNQPQQHSTKRPHEDVIEGPHPKRVNMVTEHDQPPLNPASNLGELESLLGPQMIDPLYPLGGQIDAMAFDQQGIIESDLWAQLFNESMPMAPQ